MPIHLRHIPHGHTCTDVSKNDLEALVELFKSVPSAYGWSVSKWVVTYNLTREVIDLLVVEQVVTRLPQRATRRVQRHHMDSE